MFQSTRPRGRTRLNSLDYDGLELCFNPRVLAGGRDILPVLVFTDSVFQSTRPRGRTRQSCRFHPKQLDVSIHASSREDATPFVFDFIKSRCFNPRVLAGGRDLFWRDCRGLAVFQSTRPRGRTRLHCQHLFLPLQVSIHASSREDATLKNDLPGFGFLFQSTRPRGRTRRG